MEHLVKRPIIESLWRGFRKRCPACGQGRLFKSYLETENSCSHCGQSFLDHRADDAPPYFTITIVGHIIIPLMLAVEKIWHPDLWVHFITWVPLTAFLCWWFLPRTKGATIGVQWALRMNGFAPSETQHKL